MRKFRKHLNITSVQELKENCYDMMQHSMTDIFEYHTIMQEDKCD